MIKLIAIDLDGTLLRDDKTISNRNKKVLQQAKEQGVKVVICTGRPLFAIKGFLERLELEDAGDYSITFNGSSVQKNDTGETLLAHFLSFEEVLFAYEEVTKLGLPLDIISGDTVIHLPAPKGRESIYEGMNPLLKVENTTIEELDPNRTFNKMVVAADQDYLDEKIAVMPEIMLRTFNLMKSRDDLLEVIHKEASKARGIHELAEYLGIKQEEVMAIGDEGNDASMIEYAGVGVVMENGNPLLKQMAQFITKSNQEDGVAYAVEQLVLTKEEE